MKPVFRPDSDLGKALIQWHSSLHDNRGARAELRRCGSTAAVVMTPTFQHLCQRWRPWIPEKQAGLDGIAAVVGLAAQLDRHQNATSIAEQMARPKGGGPVISELRFRRLLQQNREELYPAMVRILRQLDRTADLPSLASSVFFWGDKVRKDWAYAYYGKLGN